MICAVKHCTKTKSRNRYFAFPKKAESCEKWIRFCRRSDTIDTKLEKVCVQHFLASDFERDLPYELGVYSKPRPLKLKPDTVPSVINRNDDNEIDYYEDQKTNTLQVVDVLSTNHHHNDDNDDDFEPIEEVVQVMVNADAYLTSLEQENTNLRRQNFKMKLDAEKDATTMDKLQKQLDKTNDRYDHFLNHLRGIFSMAQLQKLQSGKRIIWPHEDLQESYHLYAISPKVYNILLQKGYPLPSQRTLRHWDAKERSQQQEDIEREQSQELTDEKQENYKLIEIIDLDHSFGNN